MKKTSYSRSQAIMKIGSCSIQFGNNLDVMAEPSEEFHLINDVTGTFNTKAYIDTQSCSIRRLCHWRKQRGEWACGRCNSIIQKAEINWLSLELDLV